jgi:hypothetical protein
MASIKVTLLYRKNCTGLAVAKAADEARASGDHVRICPTP